jgi:Protein of unknown function, DUF481
MILFAVRCWRVSLRSLRTIPGHCLLGGLLAAAPALVTAQPTSSGASDVLVLGNGDTLHGKLVKEVDGKVTFHADRLGDLNVPWSDVKELHSNRRFAVLDKTVKPRGKKNAGQIPVGSIDVQDQTVTVRVENGGVSAKIPVKNAAYIVDQATLNQQINHQPSFLAGWNGAATAGATIVQATQNQYTETGSVGLARVVPGVEWLNPRNRTSLDFSGSFGKISQPGTATVKTAIYHADAERDQYISSRLFGLAQVAFDHNFAQNLALQAVYGGGLGYTAVKTPRKELDVKATIQYESQEFLAIPPVPAIPRQNLIGSTFSANFIGAWKLFSLTQGLAFVPAYNNPRAYSANETDTITFPAYKNLGFSVGTLDSYLNDPPLSTPPTKRNSFQFTMGLTYAIKSKY